MKKKFCLVGVDQDFNDFLIENKKSATSKFKTQHLQSLINSAITFCMDFF